MISIKKHALLCVESVLYDHITFDKAFELHCKEERLLEWRSNIYELGLGVIRTRGRLTFYLDQLKLKKKPKGHLETILWLVLYQLVFQDRVEEKKIIYEAVELTKILCSKEEASFVNYLFRNNSEKIISLHSSKHSGLKGLDREKYLCLGSFLYQKLNSQYSPKWIDSYSEASLQRPQFFCRYLNNKDAQQIKESHLQASKVSETQIKGAYLILDFEILKDSHAFFVQDIGFQRVLSELCELIKDKSQENLKVLDLCAAPGGKSFFLSDKGYSVFATDYNSQRLDVLRKNAIKLGLSIQVLDYEDPLVSQSNEKFDLIVIDAPCTSSGTLRKNPEVRWSKNEAHLIELCKIQNELLTHASKKLSKNGVIFYSVCSVIKEEGERQIKNFLTEHPDFNEKKSWSYSPLVNSNVLEDGHYASILMLN